MFKVYYNGFQKKFSNQNLFLVLVFLVNHKKNKINQILQVRSYSLTTSSVFTSKSLDTINPWFITGFTDAEGSFSISVNKDNRQKIGWLVRLSYSIGNHIKDRPLLEKIKLSLGVNCEITKQGPESVQFRVRSIEQIPKIIEHFDNYPLNTQKRAYYELLKKAFFLIKTKEHLTQDGFKKLVAIKASVNWGLSPSLKKAFPDIVPVVRPLVKTQTIVNPDWLAGFTSGDGCFMVKIRKDNRFYTGFQVLLVFRLTQHSKDEQLMRSLIKYFNCGYVSIDRDYCNFEVTKFSDITKNIIPFFQQYPIRGVKAIDFSDWCQVAEMMKQKNIWLLKD